MPTPLQFSLGFCFNLLITLLIVRGIYYPTERKKKQTFTLIAFNSVVFVMMTILTTVELGIGTAFGLFALFSVLRYRTDPMNTRDMTYLFVLIGLPVINAVPLMPRAPTNAMPTVIVGNLFLVFLLFALEKGWGFDKNNKGVVKVKLQTQKIIYPRNDLLRPENYEALLETLRKETGLPIVEIKRGKLDMIENLAELTLLYSEDK